MTANVITHGGEKKYSVETICNIYNYDIGPKSKSDRKKEREANKKDPMQVLVKACAREQIWTTTKFLDDATINRMRIEKHDGYDNSVVGKLLKHCRRDDLDPVLQLQFWRKYSRTVKDELNKMKTNCMKQIKNEVKNGKLIMNVCHFFQ